jgi:hypothetical protein
MAFHIAFPQSKDIQNPCNNDIIDEYMARSTAKNVEIVQIKVIMA